MLNVPCEGCKAPYSIDERRVPDAGLKMRCPKCGHAFLVRKPERAASPLATPPAPPAGGGGAARFGEIELDLPLVAGRPATPGASANERADAGGRPPSMPDFGELDLDLPALAADLPTPSAGVRTLGRPPAVSGSAAKPVAPAPRPAPPLPPSHAKPSLPGQGAPPVTAPKPARGGPSTMPTQPEIPVAKVGRPQAAAAPMSIDLPIVQPELPAVARRPAPPAPAPKGSPLGAKDLPIVQPAAKGARRDPGGDLPARFEPELPAVFGRGVERASASGGAALPELAAHPRGADLPALAEPAVALPVARAAADLPAVFAGAELPVLAPDAPHLPAPVEDARFLPSRSAEAARGPAPDATASPFDDFGELELPTEADLPPAPAAPHERSGAFPPFEEPTFASTATAEPAFGELDFGDPLPPPAPARPAEPPLALSGDSQASGPAFGEIALGEIAEASSIATEAAIPTRGAPSKPPASPFDEAIGLAAVAAPPPASRMGAAAPVRLERPRNTRDERKAPRGKWIAAAVLASLVAGGGALQLTPYGAFAHLAIADAVHASEYARRVAQASTDARTRFGQDTYADASRVAEDLAREHGAAPRARALQAYAAYALAFVDLRFGSDAGRTSRAQRFVHEAQEANPSLPELPLAAGAHALAVGDDVKAARVLDAAPQLASGPYAVEASFLRGEIALKRRDAKAAVLAFERAAASPSSAQASFGLARAHALAGDVEKARDAIEKTLASNPEHVGARILRAELALDHDYDAQAALGDAEAVLGAGRAAASPLELGAAHAVVGASKLLTGDTAGARAAFEQASKLESRSARALVGLGDVLVAEGRTAEALGRYEAAAQIDPSFLPAIVGTASCKVQLEQLAAAKATLAAARERFPKAWELAHTLAAAEQALGNREEAERYAREAMSLVSPSHPHAVEPFQRLASMLASQGRGEEAERALDEARAKLPSTAALHRAIGEVAASRGKFDAAVKEFGLALARDPKSLKARFQLATTLRRTKRFDDARTEFDAIAAADPAYPGLALERGLLFEQAGELAKALEQFQSALAKAPDDPDLALRVGAAFVAIRRPDDALPVLKTVLDKRPTSAEAHHFVGRAYLARGEASHAEAMRFLKRAVELDPNRAEYHLYVGWAANDAVPAQLGLARDAIDKAIALDSLLPEAYWQRGVVLRKQGAVEDALRDLRRALELKPTLDAAHASLAETYEDKNLGTLAMGEWARAIAADDSQPYWRYRYGRLLAEKGNVQEAARHLAFAADKAAEAAARPGWLATAEFNAAETLRRAGRRAEAVEHYKRFLAIAPAQSPDRADAARALASLEGAPR
jgi:predicted Zn finger-like uncharacterized protein